MTDMSGRLPLTRHVEAVPSDDPAVDVWLDELRETVAPKRAHPTAGQERVAYIFGGETMARRAFPLQIVCVRLTKTGRWAKVRDLTAEALAAGTARPIGADDAIIGRFLRVYDTSYQARTSLAEEIVRRIVATGRAHFDSIDAPVLTLGQPRRATLEWAIQSDGTQRPNLIFDEAWIRMLPGHVPWYVDSQTGVTGPIDAGMAGPALAALLLAPPLDPVQAKRVRDAFAITMPRSALPAPRQIAQRAVRVQPVPHLTLRKVRVAPSMLTIEVAELAFLYDRAVVDPASPAFEVRHVDGSDVLVYPRMHKVEDRAAQRLESLGLYDDAALRNDVESVGTLFRYAGDDEARWSAFAHRSVPELRAEGWIVDVDAGARHQIVDMMLEDLWHTQISEHADGWFDLAIGIDVGGRRVDLLPMLRDLMQRTDALGNPAILESLRPGDVYYLAVDRLGATLAFPAERIKAIVETLVELGDPESLDAAGALRLPRARAAVVDELAAASHLRWDVPERLRELGERLRDFEGIERVDVPASFTGTLRPYQRDGLDWLQFLAGYGFGGILADDMGLGKSVQTLVHLLCEKEAGRLEHPALLVVPTSLVYNWCDEAARFTPKLRVLSLHGSLRAQRFEEIDRHDLVITTYALLVRDTELRERSWHAVILDEAQALKNPQSKVAQAAMALRASHRICLTGTPVENHLGDLWSLFSIALPGALGDRKHFTRVFRTPIEKRGDVARSRLLAARIAPFLLRRTKEAVARELPEKTEIVQRVELVGAQRDLYETVRIAMQERVREEIATHGLGRSQIVILDALLKLRQVCCDPRLLPPRLRKAAESVKLDLLLEMVPQMIDEGRRVLLFSQFTSMLDLIAPELQAREIPFVTLTGQTKDRETAVKRFQRGDVPLFLISLKAGGTGLNLNAADTVIHYDPWWNPAVERQATDRAHRIGQTQHVFVYKLIGVGTVEEKIVELQARKAELAAAIFSQEAGASVRFAAEDVERLFAPISTPAPV